MIRQRIYIAGPLTPKGNRPDAPNPAIEYLLNVRDMLSAYVKLVHKGWAPYCPAFDFSGFFQLSNGDVLSEQEVKDVSLAFEDACPTLCVLPRWQTSRGTVIEVEKAQNENRTIYFGVEAVPDLR